MSADNNPFMKREIQALRNEEPRQDAKAELILELRRERRESKMSILKKATLPTLVSVAAIAGVFYVSQPKVMAATPDRVMKAIQDIKNYTIKSFVIEGNDRHIQSKTTVNGKNRNIVYYDEKGHETSVENGSSFVMIQNSPMKMGFKVRPDGALENMTRDDINKVKASFHVVSDASGLTVDGAEGKKVRVEVKKGPNGTEEKHFFVNGKEVDKLPEDLNAHLGAPGPDGGPGQVKFKITKDSNGKEEKHIYVNGKEVKTLPNGMILDGKNPDKHTVKIEVTKGPDGKEIKHYYVNGKEVDKIPDGMMPPVRIHAGQVGDKDLVLMNDRKITEGASTKISKSLVLSSDGNPMMMTSGQTSADYLISLLKDTTRWTIERGVSYNGQTLDKFTLKGPVSPIVLYVDPATALPKVLRFETPFQEGATIEDVYEYGIQP